MKQFITGLFGYPLKHSLSPQMHNAAFKALGLDNWQYQLFEFEKEQLEPKIKDLRGNKDIVGVNVTVPYKIDVMQYLDELDETAINIGALNTIKKENGILKGYNTDAIGFYHSLLYDLGIEQNNLNSALILGCGGAARAIIYILLKKFNLQEIFLFDKKTESANSLAQDFVKMGTKLTVLNEKNLLLYAKKIDLLINATGLGSSHNIGKSPLNQASFHKEQLVYDLGYNPQKTAFLEQAEKAKAKYSNGLGMLIRQGLVAFEIFTGLKPDYQVMADALSKAKHSSQFLIN